MANLLIERTQNSNWVVVYKALITIHNIMCYGKFFLQVFKPKNFEAMRDFRNIWRRVTPRLI